MPINEDDLAVWLAWRERVDKMKRVMTVGEYKAWCFGGDGVSHPSSSNSLSGGLIILADTPPVIGLVVSPSGEHVMPPMPPVIRSR